MNNLNFQNVSPSDVDVVKSESHDRVAQAMHDYLKPKTNHRVIGLDGEFGSGKSSILQMLEKKIVTEKSKTKLWLFDCEQNYQGSIKSNFVQQLTEQVTELLKTLGREKQIAEVETSRDIALGRHYSVCVRQTRLPDALALAVRIRRRVCRTLTPPRSQP